MYVVARRGDKAVVRVIPPLWVYINKTCTTQNAYPVGSLKQPTERTFSIQCPPTNHGRSY